MGIITKMKKQKALHWKKGADDGFGGVIYTTPEIISCRWQNAVNEVIDNAGEKIISNILVFPEIVPEIGDYLALYDGNMSLTSNPQQTKGSFRVKDVKVIPNLKNTEILIKVLL